MSDAEICVECKGLKPAGALCPKCYPHTTAKVTPGPGPHDYTMDVVISKTCQTCLYGTPLVFKEQRLQKGKPEDVSMVRCRRFPRHETMPPEETCGEWKGKAP